MDIGEKEGPREDTGLKTDAFLRQNRDLDLLPLSFDRSGFTMRSTAMRVRAVWDEEPIDELGVAPDRARVGR